MLTVLRQRNFLFLWVAGLISMAGDWVLMIALPIYVYSLTHSTLALSATAAVEVAPTLLFGSVAGVYVDRWPRKATLLAAYTLLGVTILPLLFVKSADLIWIVYLVAFVQSTIAQFANPAEQALLPTLVSEDLLVTANSLSSLNSNTARLVGPALGGLLFTLGGLTGVTLADAVTFFIAAGLVSLMSVQRSEPDSLDSREIAHPAVWHQWLEGLRLVRGSTGLSVLIAIFALTSLGEGVMGTMFVVWIKEVIHGGALQLGWFMSAQAVGGVVGGLVMGMLGTRLVPYRLAWMAGILFASLDIALFSYPVAFPGIWIGLALMVIIGIPAAGAGSSYLTLLQTATEDAFRGRVFGALSTTMALTRLIGAGIAGVAGGIFGPIVLLNVFQGGSYLVASLALCLMSGQLALRLAKPADRPAVTEA